MNLYLIKYSANEFNDPKYDSPYPIFYSLDKDKTKEFFERKREKEIKSFDQFLEKFPEYKNTEDYQVYENLEHRFEIHMGNWYYQWELDKVKLDMFYD